MRTSRTAVTIGASLIGLGFLLATPHSANSQGLTATSPSPQSFAYGTLRPVSWFNWNGIWVRSNGRWAWRPTRGPDWQAYFKCRMGYGSAAYGWGLSPLSWLPDPHAGWALGVGGWTWYPGDRFRYSWDPWYPGSGYWGVTGFGSSCSYPFAWSSFLAIGWGGGLTLVYGFPRYPTGAYGYYGDRQGYGYGAGHPGYVTIFGRLPPGAIGRRHPDGTRIPYDRDRDRRTGTGRSDDDRGAETDARAFIDPVRTESLDRTLWTRPGTAVWSEPDRGTRVRIESARPAPARGAPERTPFVAPTRNAGPSTAKPIRSSPRPKATVPGSAARQPFRVNTPARPTRPAKVTRPAKTGGKKDRKQ